jgi:D-glycero-D-manno-heptose 1,7-bisphosphate phosphatase
MGVHPVSAALRAVFLDRDGVLNRAFLRDGKPYPPATLEEFQIVPSAREDLRRLRDLGMLAIVVSNQPDIARGTQSTSIIEQMNSELRRQLPVDDVFICPHDDGDHCDCRKPKPGLLLRAARKYGLDLSKCFMVGDRWRDIDAGAAAGCATILVDFHYHERSPAAPPTYRVASLKEAVDSIVRQVEEECA